MIRFRESFKRHVSDNIWLYGIIIFFFILGICIGALTVNNIDVETKNSLNQYIDGFLNITRSEGINSFDVLKEAVKNNFFTTLLVVIMGLTYVGIVFIPLLAGFRGFCIGFVIAFLTDSMGNSGYLLSLVSILPQNIIYIPTIIIICVYAFNISMNTLRNKFLRKRNFFSSYLFQYFITSTVLFVVLLGGSIIESYITPLLIKLLSQYIS